MKLYPHGETPSTPRRSASPYCGISSLFEYTGPSKTMEAKAAGEAVIDRFIAEKMAALEAERVRLDMLRVEWRAAPIDNEEPQ